MHSKWKPFKNWPPHLEFNEFHISFYNRRQIFCELCSCACAQFHFWTQWISSEYSQDLNFYLWYCIQYKEKITERNTRPPYIHWLWIFNILKNAPWWYSKLKPICNSMYICEEIYSHIHCLHFIFCRLCCVPMPKW